MKVVHWLLTVIVFWLGVLELCWSYPYVIQKNATKTGRLKIGLEEVRRGSFYYKGFNGTWISDNAFIYKHNNSVLAYHVDDQRHEVLLEKDILVKYISYEFSPDMKQVLFRYDISSVFRHSSTAKYDVYDIATKTAHHVKNEERLQYCTWSPTGNSVVFVLDNNLYIRTSSGEERQLTDDGISGVLYNGVADWVYEEEVLGDSKAFWFSPDSKKLAMIQFDDRYVETYTLLVYGEPGDLQTQYPAEIFIKYPKPGTNNPKVALKVLNLSSLNSIPKWITIPAPKSVTDDHIIQNVAWVDNDNLLVTWLNRRQNKGSIQSCTTDGKCREVTSLNEPDGWIEIGVPECIEGGKNCLFTYWIDNWIQIWNLDLNTGENIGKSYGNFTVTQLYGYKKSNGDIFYQGTTKDDPSQRQVYKNKECLSCDLKDPEGKLCTYASASFSKEFKYAAIQCSGPGPLYTKLVEIKTGEISGVWEDNLEKRKELKNYELPNMKYLRVDVPGGYQAQVKLYYPPELDIEATEHTKKYPMIVSVYGGPNSVRVMNSFSIGWETYLVTSRKVIYALIDGRGSGQKGKKMLFEVNNRLGSVEVDDQLNVTRYLRDHYKFIDPDRIGIWGWSYGGYVTAMSLAKDRERVFQCGISVAPVTSWIYYDSIYTERYMGLPKTDDNLIGYEKSDVTRRTEGFKNHDFLLIHGTGDDNVHYQQAMALSRALQTESILFEQMSYPDEAHSLGSVQPHLYHTMDQFWCNCLNLETEDEQNHHHHNRSHS